MIIIFVIVAFILAWFFIEITLFLANKNFVDFNEVKKISYNKFIWNLRILAIFLFFFTAIYMYYIPEKHRNSLKIFLLWPLEVGCKWHKIEIFQRWLKSANLLFLAPDFTYN